MSERSVDEILESLSDAADAEYLIYHIDLGFTPHGYDGDPDELRSALVAYCEQFTSKSESQ